MPQPSESGPSARRALWSFWILILVAIAAGGSLRAALTAESGALTGVRVALSGLVLLVALTLAARIVVFHERARRRSRG